MKWKIQRQIIIMSKYAVIGLFIQCLLVGMLLANTSIGQKKNLEEIYIQNCLEQQNLKSIRSIRGRKGPVGHQRNSLV